MINEIEKNKGYELDAEARKMVKKFTKAVFEYIFEMVHVMVLPRKNSYKEYWRWITTVLDLAAERGIPPTELLAIENVTDEITRRMFTKRRFIAFSKQALKKFVDADVLKKIIIEFKLLKNCLN